MIGYSAAGENTGLELNEAWSWLSSFLLIEFDFCSTLYVVFKRETLSHDPSMMRLGKKRLFCVKCLDFGSTAVSADSHITAWNQSRKSCIHKTVPLNDLNFRNKYLNILKSRYIYWRCKMKIPSLGFWETTPVKSKHLSTGNDNYSWPNARCSFW